ncbi:MAG: F0F1 ATP synthase subunit A [Gemmatimonadaceae bacterium]|nr:F0F1 ATP synthase subunit A [Gemmatimonadaceae bacterium]
MKLGSLLLLALLAVPVGAQQPGAHPAPAAVHADSSATVRVNDAVDASLGGGPAAVPGETERHDIIMPHITDSHHLEIPWPNAAWGREIELPRWTPVHVGGIAIDLSPTKHVVMLLLAATLCAVLLITVAHAHRRHTHEVGVPRGFASGLEAVVLYVRNEVILANVGPHGNGFVPYLLTLFFFILFANVLGLIPYLSTATGNISVTATLAIMSFLTIEVAGMRALGKGYLGTIFYWPSDMPFGLMKIVLFLILTPVELLGKFTKPFALAIRLFANMTAGHVIVLAFIGIIFTFGSVWIAPAPFAMALGIMLLEVLVSLIQAYLFTLLTTVFIGQIREAHH